jgi:hypothetical protein
MCFLTAYGLEHYHWCSTLTARSSQSPRLVRNLDALRSEPAPTMQSQVTEQGRFLDWADTGGGLSVRLGETYRLGRFRTAHE